MSFNIQKYLINNKLTRISKKRLFEEGSSEKNAPENKNTEKDKKELDLLKAKAKDIIFKYTEDTPQGRKMKGSVSDFKRAMGNIPQKIDALKKKLGIETKDED